MFQLPLNPSLSSSSSYGMTHEAIFCDHPINNHMNPIFLEKPYHHNHHHHHHHHHLHNLPNILPHDHTTTFVYSSSPASELLFQHQTVQCHHGHDIGLQAAVDPLIISNDYQPSSIAIVAEEAGKEVANSKKKASDRHSKIAVKNRLRHRRTRLSIEVARQLFELQDMLKFERASKAVEWLLVRARPDIAKLRRELNPGSSASAALIRSSGNNSECEAFNSGLDEEYGKTTCVDDAATASNDDKKKKKKTRRRASGSRRGALYSPKAKEEREKARNRARERTLNKKRTQSSSLSTSWQSVESRGLHEQPQQQQLAVNNLLLPDDLFHDIGMSFEMATI